MKQQLIVKNNVVFEGTKHEVMREVMKRNLSVVQYTATKVYASEEIFADFGNFYTDI